MSKSELSSVWKSGSGKRVKKNSDAVMHGVKKAEGACMVTAPARSRATVSTTGGVLACKGSDDGRRLNELDDMKGNSKRRKDGDAKVKAKGREMRTFHDAAGWTSRMIKIAAQGRVRDQQPTKNEPQRL